MRTMLRRLFCRHDWSPYRHLGGGLHERTCPHCRGRSTLDTR